MYIAVPIGNSGRKFWALLGVRPSEVISTHINEVCLLNTESFGDVYIHTYSITIFSCALNNDSNFLICAWALEIQYFLSAMISPVLMSHMSLGPKEI